MELSEFTQLLQTLDKIEGDQLPELTTAQQVEFVINPVRYFMRGPEAHRRAIWRELILFRYSSGRKKVKK